MTFLDVLCDVHDVVAMIIIFVASGFCVIAIPVTAPTARSRGWVESVTERSSLCAIGVRVVHDRLSITIATEGSFAIDVLDGILSVRLFAVMSNFYKACVQVL